MPDQPRIVRVRRLVYLTGASLAVLTSRRGKERYSTERRRRSRAYPLDRNDRFRPTGVTAATGKANVGPLPPFNVP